MDYLKTFSVSCEPFILVSTNAKGNVPDPFPQNSCKLNTQRPTDNKNSPGNEHRKRTDKEKLTHVKKLQGVISKDLKHQDHIYYTGGSLDTLTQDDDLLLFYARNTSRLEMVRMARTDKTWLKKRRIKLGNCNEYNCIYQIEAARKDNIIMAGIRCADYYQLHLFDDHDNLNSKKTIEFEKHYVSSSIDKRSSANIALIDAGRKLTIWDTKKKKAEIEIPDDNSQDSFSQVTFLNEHSMGIVNRHNLYIFDQRESQNLNATWNTSDTITSFCSNKTNDYICYVTTRNETSEIDLRTKNVVNNWQYFLPQGVPYLTDNLTVNNNTLVCASSSFSKEKVLFGHDGRNRYFPYILPNVEQTLDEIMLNTDELTKFHLMKHRIGLSTTGLKLLQINGKSLLLSANSIGDIFVHDLEEQCDRKFKVKQFTNWNKKLCNTHECLPFVEKCICRHLQPVLCQDSDKQEIKNSRLEHLRFRLIHADIEMSSRLEDPWSENVDNVEAIDTIGFVEDWLKTCTTNDNT